MGPTPEDLSRSWVISNPTCPRAQRSSDTLQWHSPTRCSPELPDAHHLAAAPPITSNRPPAQPDRADPSSPSASMRPAVPPACRPNCPGRPAWTRQPLGRAAQRLHTGKPCHAVLHSTLHTLQEYGKENYEKKIPIHRSNNVLQEPGGGTCAQHTWHQLWTRANPAYVFLVPQPLVPHNNRSLRAGTRTASTRPRTPAHTLPPPHGRLQRAPTALHSETSAFAADRLRPLHRFLPGSLQHRPPLLHCNPRGARLRRYLSWWAFGSILVSSECVTGTGPIRLPRCSSWVPLRRQCRRLQSSAQEEGTMTMQDPTSPSQPSAYL